MQKQFECKNCGAYLEFDPSTQALKCDFCDSKEVIEVEHKAILEHDFFSAPTSLGWDRQVTTIKCDSCGATTTWQKKVAGDCAFCGSPHVKQQPTDENIIRPETLVTFKVDDKKAKSLFHDWISKGFFRPSALKKMGQLENLSGVYVPFWTYDTATHSNWTADSGYYYYETESYTAYEKGPLIGSQG
jgi:Zn finger protein HypA/HybF involved in hydrogenase expression